MKAVVMEIKGTKAVTLSEDGTFTNSRNKGYSIGQSIEVEGNRMKKMSRKYKNIAMGIAASMVILLGGGSAYAYNTPVAQVSLDVNPSVTYTVNTFNKVIDVDLNNSKAKSILETVDWDGEDIEQVIADTISALKAGEYLNEGDWYINSLLVGVNADSSDREAKLIATIKQEIVEIVAEESKEDINKKVLDSTVVGIGAERVAEANRLSDKLGIPVTPGKLNLVQKLGDDYEEMTTEQAILLFEKPVKEIMAQIKANKQLEKGITPKAVDAEMDVTETEDDLDINDKVEGNANDNPNKIKNGNNGQNDVVRETIETEETEETEND